MELIFAISRKIGFGIWILREMSNSFVTDAAVLISRARDGEVRV